MANTAPLTVAFDIPAAALAPPENNPSHPETERHARELTAMAALARDFSDPDLALAHALLIAVAKAASER